MLNLTELRRPWPPRPETLLLHQVEETPSSPPPTPTGPSCDTTRRKAASGLGCIAQPKRINKWHHLHTIAIQSRRTEMMTARYQETDTESLNLHIFLHISVSLQFCDTHDNESRFQLTGSHTFFIFKRSLERRLAASFKKEKKSRLYRYFQEWTTFPTIHFNVLNLHENTKGQINSELTEIHQSDALLQELWVILLQVKHFCSSIAFVQFFWWFWRFCSQTCHQTLIFGSDWPKQMWFVLLLLQKSFLFSIFSLTCFLANSFTANCKNEN